MRRPLCLLALAALLALSMTALAAFALPTANGTLAVKNGDGTVIIAARGALIGTLGEGRLKFVDPAEDDTQDLVVKGCEIRKSPEDNTLICSGKDIRFRVIGGRFNLRLVANDMNLSLVGTTAAKGQKVQLQASGPDGDYDGEPDFDNNDGDFKVDDDVWKSLPVEKKTLQLGD